jgi:hypothetical protein
MHEDDKQDSRHAGRRKKTDALHELVDEDALLNIGPLGAAAIFRGRRFGARAAWGTALVEGQIAAIDRLRDEREADWMARPDPSAAEFHWRDLLLRDRPEEALLPRLLLLLRRRDEL